MRRVSPFTGDQTQTCGLFSLFQKGGTRCSSAMLVEEMKSHPRFRLLEGHTVRRVLIHGDRACGVELLQGARRFRVVATSGVLLAAGALQTPLLLQRSGVGPADLLRRAGIKVAMELPGVGEGLQDHAGAPVLVRSGVPSPGRKSRWIPAAIRWLLDREGVMVSNCCEAGCFLGETASPPTGEIFTHFQTARHPQAVELMCALLRPASRGSVRIDVADPWGAPLVDPAYLSDPADVAALKRIVEAARRIVSQPALKAFGLAEELLPGGLDLEAFLRSHTSTCHHPVSSCRMGAGGDSVVGPDLEVHGVERLWVADNSITPAVPRGHTAATALIIAAHGARLVSSRLNGSPAVCTPPPPESPDCRPLRTGPP
jgi:choline dehydrogenase-like flavoprotein